MGFNIKNNYGPNIDVHDGGVVNLRQHRDGTWSTGNDHDAEEADYEEVEEIADEESAEGSTTNDKTYTLSPLDGIFHKALNLVKVKKAIQDIIIMKGEEGKFRLSVKQTFILHKVLEEIDWLDDDTDTTFIQWYDDVYKWPWKTRDFKAVLSPFKKTSSTKWNEDTVKDANTGREYRDFANYVRSQFVDIGANGKITDKQEFLKLGSDGKPMYIGHQQKCDNAGMADRLLHRGI
ncbi:MAG: hypothetical protein IJ887_17340 [Prevotella sp.]|nr:hypothetical protein [Prevotella sp.]